MYRSIVVGTDGSPSAQEAVRRAGELAALCGARLAIVSAYRPVAHAAVLAMSGAAGGLLLDPAELVEQQRQEADEALEHAMMMLDATAPFASTVSAPGNPAEVLLAIAADKDADLIVVGNRGMQGAARFLLGSVPNRVAHHASCSVLIVQTI
ncbi:MAG: universal stress protein [Frankiaceae bacterium]|nr:universal stress protein [Frankiaceae bacterium]